MMAMGLFFLVLAMIFGLAARAGHSRGEQKMEAPATVARRRIAILFAIVGTGLLIWSRL
jgi:hypothetical protein